MPDESATYSPRDPHPTVSGKKILLGSAIGCVVLFFVVWASLRTVEHDLSHSRETLVWADRVDWIAPTAIVTTLVKPNAANAQYTYNKPRYRDPGFAIPPEEQQKVLACAELARSPEFTGDTTRRSVLQHAVGPPHFYAQFLLATWHNVNRDSSRANELYQQAFELAPKVLVIQYHDPNGRPVADLELGTIEIGCDRVVDDGTRLDQRLVLAYPMQQTDAAGRIYLPVYDTTYRPVTLPQPVGYNIHYRPKEGWFSLPSRLGAIHAVVLQEAASGATP